MTEDRIIETTLKLTADEQALAKVKAATKSVEDSLKKIQRAAKFDEIAEESAFFTQNVEETADAVALLAKSLAEVGASEAEIERTTAQIVKMKEASEDAAAAAEKAAASSFRGGATGVASGAAGVGGIVTGGKIGVTEIAALSRELPRLKEGFSGLKEGAGAVTAALAGAAVVAAVAVVAFNLLATAVNKSGQEEERKLNREEELFQVSQLSGDAAVARLKVERELLAENQRRQAAAVRDIEIERNTRELSDAFSVLGSDAEDTAEKLRDAATEQIAASEELIAVLEGKGVDAFEAIAAAAEEAAVALLNQATLAGDTVRFQQEATERGVQATEDRIAAIEDESAVIEAKLAVLRTANKENEQATAQIAALENSLIALGVETEIATDAISSGAAAMVDAALAAEEAAKEAAREQEAALKKQAADQQRAFEKQASDAIRAAEKRNDDAIKAADDFNKTQDDFLEDQAKFLEKTRKDEADDLRKHKNTIRDIDREADEDIEDALFDADFKAAFLAEKNRVRDLNKQNEKFDEERRLSRDASIDALEELQARFTAEIALYEQVAMATSQIIGGIFNAANAGIANIGRTTITNNNSFSVSGSGNPGVVATQIFGLLEQGAF